MMKHIKIRKFFRKYGDWTDWLFYIVGTISIILNTACYFIRVAPNRTMFIDCCLAWIIILLQALMINELKKRIRLNNKRK